MELGYTRVSTRGQKADSQIARLEAAGCEKIFVDLGYSSRLEDRPEWNKCREIQRDGDRLTIPALDRVAGTDTIALSVMRDHAERGVKFRSLDEPWMDIDPSTAMGEAMLKIMATLAHLRVALIRENTMRGIEFARSQGRFGGRPTVMTPERIAVAKQMRAEGKSFESIARVLDVGSSSVSRALARAEELDAS
ncbi:MAG TPA: recombinase family protein [Candidatus Agrococcus pullicola]|uniref:Recombinase family protein n=1 Tax=Candidatus Agrococcus pullicola TaxID=2838429 RepID=A0A9D1YWI1_9MICO|nr:recombinase family protein [Candidatus Agrococcus pullicola]